MKVIMASTSNYGIIPDMIVDLDTLFESQYQDEWLMSFEKRIYGYTHTNHPSNQTVLSKWTSVSKIVSISNLNTQNQSLYSLYFVDSRYSLKDVIVGKIYFLLVRLKIKHMELSIIRRETTGVAPNQYNESETITKFEIMDGAPVRGETIPIRLFLGGFDLTPTFKDVNKKFSTRYYLSLVLVDNDGRRYFKQSEITLVRSLVDMTDDSFVFLPMVPLPEQIKLRHRMISLCTITTFSSPSSCDLKRMQDICVSCHCLISS
jgi:Vacuolar protein sorting-associated protein 26